MPELPVGGPGIRAPRSFDTCVNSTAGYRCCRARSGYLKQLHSGEQFGALGTWLFTFAGLALTVFVFSGLWMYLQMFGTRQTRNLKPGWCW